MAGGHEWVAPLGLVDFVRQDPGALPRADIARPFGAFIIRRLGGICSSSKWFVAMNENNVEILTSILAHHAPLGGVIK